MNLFTKDVIYTWMKAFIEKENKKVGHQLEKNPSNMAAQFNDAHKHHEI